MGSASQSAQRVFAAGLPAAVVATALVDLVYAQWEIVREWLVLLGGAGAVAAVLALLPKYRRAVEAALRWAVRRWVLLWLLAVAAAAGTVLHWWTPIPVVSDARWVLQVWNSGRPFPLEFPDSTEVLHANEIEHDSKASTPVVFTLRYAFSARRVRGEPALRWSVLPSADAVIAAADRVDLRLPIPDDTLVWVEVLLESRSLYVPEARSFSRAIRWRTQ